MKVSVIGGGNIGTQVACVCAAKGHDVTVLSSKPKSFDDELEIIDEFGRITTGRMRHITNLLQEAVENQDVVFVTYPAFKLKELADQMLPYIRAGLSICVMPGTGGAEFAFRECIKSGATLCGLQRVPSVARLEKYGKRVRCEGLRDHLYLAAIPNHKANELAAFISSLWEIPCTALPNYLSVTLTPSNPILHTTRLRTLFSDYKEGVVYPRNPLFYGEWNDTSSELLIACDDELQKICRTLSGLDLSYVRSLKEHYESDSAEKMTSKLSSIRSLHNLSSPMKQLTKGWIPDFDSRYFTADFPFGLAIIEELGKILSVETPNVCQTMDWYREVTGVFEHFKFEDYGIHDITSLYQVYEV